MIEAIAQVIVATVLVVMLIRGLRYPPYGERGQFWIDIHGGLHPGDDPNRKPTDWGDGTKW